MSGLTTTVAQIHSRYAHKHGKHNDYGLLTRLNARRCQYGSVDGATLIANVVTLARNLIPDLDRANTQPLAEQIARFYREAIEGGRLRAGDRLPPIREVAEGISVTRATVQEAYRKLGEGAYVEGVVGRGTTVLPGKVVADTAGASSLLSAYATAEIGRAHV